MELLCKREDVRRHGQQKPAQGGKFQFGKRRIGQLFQFSMDGAVCCFSR